MTRHQVRAVNAPCFLRLLRALRIQTPTPDHVYPLVPLALPATYLFAAAQKVAPLEPGSLKFDPADLTRPEVPAEMAAQTEEMTDVSHDLLPPPPPPPPSLTPLRSSNWMALVSRQKAGFPQLLQPPVMSRGGSGGQLTPPDSGGGDVSMDEDDPYGPVTSSC